MRSLWGSRLSRKLTILALLVALPYLALAGGLVVLVYAALNQSLQSTANTVAHHTLDTLDRVLFERYGDALVFSRLPVVRSLDRESILKVADLLVVTYAPYYRLAIVADRQGRILAVNRVDGAGHALPTSSLVGRSVSGEPWFQNALRASQPVLIEDFHVDPMVQEVYRDGSPVVSFSTPIRNDAGEVVGVWSTRLAGGPLAETLTLVSQAYSLSAPLPVVLVNQRGQPLMGTAQFDSADIQRPTGRARHQPEPVLLADVKSAGYAAYPGLGWHVLVYAPSTQSGLQIKLIRLAVLPVLLLMAGIVGLWWLITKYVLKPLRILTEQVRCLAQRVRVFSEDIGMGRVDLGGVARPPLMRAPQQTPGYALAEREDEFGELSRSFSAMGGQVQDQLRRFHGLFEVSQAIERARFSLPEILQLVVETGMRLTGARYGALGVFDETGERLTQFITSGLDEATQQAIGDPPTGRGLLGHLAHEEGVLRLKDLTQHPAFAGFPPHHPPMHSFIGESIRVHGRLFGRLYLTEKQGVEEFTAQDEEVVCSLVTLAGLAIENSTLLKEIGEAQAKHRLLLESTNEGLWGLDLEGRCTFINRAGAQMLGYRPEEVVGQHMHALVHHSHHDGSPYPADECLMYRAFRTGASCSVDHEVLWRHDGTAFPVEYTSAPLIEAGAVTGAVVAFADITSRKRAAEALRESELRFRSVIQSATDAIILADHHGTILSLNTAAQRIFGYEEREVLGRPLTLLMPERYRDAHRSGLERLRTTGETRILGTTVALVGLRKDGTEFPMECSLATWSIGADTFFSGIVRDVTDRKDLETQLRQSQKMEAIGRLAGGIAHDFNNLLTVIGGYSQMLLKRLGPTDPLRGEVEEINTAGDRAAALTSQLLAFSRQQVLQPRVLDLNAVVANMEGMLTRLIGEDVTLRSVLSPELGRVRADPGQMEQVIMNLAINARDAMPCGGQLTIETANVELNETYARQVLTIIPGPHVMVAVSDTGCGMDADTLARIFEPFFTTKPKDKGTGLGLSTVYGIVKQSGGSIWAYSEPEKGTTFKIYLPRVEEAAETVQPQPHCLPIPTGAETILLVEDEAGVRTLLRSTLQASGYTVLEAANGAEALQRYEQRKGPVQLLVTDVVMPGMNGRELATRLVGLHPHMKVLFMSGYTDDTIVRHGVSEAGVAFLQKPFAPIALARKVREVLDGVQS